MLRILKNTEYIIYIVLTLFISVYASVSAAKDGLKALAYPESQPDANSIAKQVFFVNRFFSFSNISIDEHPNNVSIIVQNSPGKKQTLTKLERHINNTYNDGVISSRELSVFRSGKLKGTAVLLTDYEDSNKVPTYMVWMPALRLTRTFEIGNTTDTWGGTVFSYSDMFMSSPDTEKHELSGKKVFDSCLNSIKIENPKNRLAKSFNNEPVCLHRDKDVYILKSYPLSLNEWYDYSVSYIDTKTFGDYRIQYYKNGKLLKTIDKDWRKSGQNDDPRALKWHHVYGKDHTTELETYIAVPDEIISVDRKLSSEFWSEESLKGLE